MPTSECDRAAGWALALTDSCSPSPHRDLPLDYHLPSSPDFALARSINQLKFCPLLPLSICGSLCQETFSGLMHLFQPSATSCPEGSGQQHHQEALLDIPYCPSPHQAWLTAPSPSFPSSLMALILVIVPSTSLASPPPPRPLWVPSSRGRRAHSHLGRGPSPWFL